ncbi:hypothetical protein ABZP36_009430 [Zizania latifolia]
MASAARDLAGDPPESTRLRIGEDVAWTDVGGVYDRDDSLKENTNPKCLLKNHPGHNGNGNGASQRFSGNLKPTAAPIIGISGKLGQGGGRKHHPPAMFPKKAKTGGGGRIPKTAVPEHEPSSPKVSCIGKVLSDRERARRGRVPRSPPGMRPGSGCCPVFGSLFRRSHSRKNAVECVDQSPPPPPPAAARPTEAKEMEETSESPPALAPALGGMRRFASGRRAAEWAAEMEEDGRAARSEPL